MATPIGHGLAGLSLFWVAAKAGSVRTMPVFWLAVLFALLPDFDFLPGLVIGRPAAYHHGISHSIGSGFAAALVGTWIARRRTHCSARVLFLLLFCCYTSHLLLDFFGSDARPPYGIPFFWPLSSDYYLSPILLFPGVRHARHTDGQLQEWLEGVVSWHNVHGIAIEMLLLLPFALVWTRRQIRNRRHHQVANKARELPNGRSNPQKAPEEAGLVRIVLKAVLVLLCTGCLTLGAGLYLLKSRGRDLSELMVYARLVDDVDWDVSSPEEVGVDSKQLSSVVTHVLKRNTDALVLVKDNKLIYEWYREGNSSRTRFPLAAAAKPLLGALLLAISVQDGAVSFDEPVSDYLPEWQNDPQKRRITFRQLASHTSGLEDVPFRGGRGAHHKEKWKRSYEADPEKRFKYAQRTAALVQEPGVRYSYSGVGYYIISYTLTRARQAKGVSPSNLRALYKERILDPLGIRVWGMSYGLAHQIDGLTMYSIGSGASLTARGMVRIGQLIKNNGYYAGRSIINESIIKEMLRPPEIEQSRERNAGAFPTAAVGWYLNSNGFFKGLPPDALIGFGAGPEVVIVCPSLDLIIARTGQSLDGSSRGSEDSSSIYFGPIVSLFSETSKSYRAAQAAKSSRGESGAE